MVITNYDDDELFDNFGLEEIMTNMHEYTKYAFGDLV